ncbi:BppU family phage baseplate upper protein [Enterococcus mundtii]|uniref:Calcineurin-like phosphoesterase domain-containing protein n=1 Tax=Enterococcus mundtii TaxID=53346 RepID=A0A242L041_ENTMU|nr:BppU family phage baseplate upper protein [Enterococcus mundtii]OTP26982.1 hypothetical protein A5802_000716 [Enterococcus mundtii]
MAETKHKLILSTTESNHGINLIRIRQGDVQTQKLVVEVVEHSTLKTFDGLVPFFINTTKFSENQPVEQKVQEYSPSQARLVYTLSEPDWQWGGENTAHFSFRSLNGDGTWSEQFSTQDFTYRVISGITRSNLRDSGYVWTFEDLLRKFREYMNTGKSDWEKWVKDNKEILESIDPGGVILEILNNSKGDHSSLPDRLDELEFKQDIVPVGMDQIASGPDRTFFNPSSVKYDTVMPRNLDVALSSLDQNKFNVAFITDTHVAKHNPDVEGIDPSNLRFEKRWNIIRRFQSLGKHCDVMVYGGDNIDGHSTSKGFPEGGITHVGQARTMNLSILKRFAAVATAGQKKPVFFCRGNHETGKIPYAWVGGRNVNNSLSGAEIAQYYNGTYGGQIFDEKNVAIYRIDTDDFSDETDENGYFKEYSGYVENGIVGCIGAKQLIAIGNWLEDLDRKNHVLLFGHIPLEDSPTGVWNTSALQLLIDGFKQGTRVTLDLDALRGLPREGYEGVVTFDFSNKGAGTVAAYVCGHWHWETQRMLGTTTMVVCINAFLSEKDYEEDLYDGFYNIEVDTTKRRLKATGVGHANDWQVNY